MTKNTRKARIFKVKGKIDLVSTVWQQSENEKPKTTSDTVWQRQFLFTLVNHMWCTLTEAQRLDIMSLAINSHEEVTLDIL